MKIINIGNLERFLNNLKNFFVKQEPGKGLSSNDLTNNMKTQYDSAYDHSTLPHAPSDAEKNIVRGVKFDTDIATVPSDGIVDIKTIIAFPPSGTTSTEVVNMINNAIVTNNLVSFESLSVLPVVDQDIIDQYTNKIIIVKRVNDSGDDYEYDFFTIADNRWVMIGSTAQSIDLSPYLTKYLINRDNYSDLELFTPYHYQKNIIYVIKQVGADKTGILKIEDLSGNDMEVTYYKNYDIFIGVGGRLIAINAGDSVDVANYVLKTELTTILESYPTIEFLEELYVSYVALDQTLLNYVRTSEIEAITEADIDALFV